MQQLSHEVPGSEAIATAGKVEKSFGQLGADREEHGDHQRSPRPDHEHDQQRRVGPGRGPLDHRALGIGQAKVGGEGPERDHGRRRERHGPRV